MKYPDKDAIIFSLAVALRRVLILVDRRRSAARAAEEALREADAALRGQQ